MLGSIDPHKMALALESLGVSVRDFEEMRRASFTRAQELLRALKERARKSFRRLALELHPDRTGNDETKTETFKALTQVFSELIKLEVRPPPPVPPPVQPVVSTWVQYSRSRPVPSSPTVTAAQRAVRTAFLRPQ